jgi:hypothetical protein
MLGFGLQHVEVETELDQGDLMMIGLMATDRERQPMTIDNGKDLHAFAAAGGADVVAPAFGRGKRRIDKALRSSSAPSSRKVLATGSGWRAGPRVRTTAEIGDEPFCSWDNTAGGHRFAAGAAFGGVFLGKMLPNPFSLVIAQSQHGGAL